MIIDSLGKGLLDFSSIADDEDGKEFLSMDSEDVGSLLDSEVKHQFVSPTSGSLYSSLVNEFYFIPDFQRKFVWSKKQVAYFGLSIIKGIPIPQLYTYVSNRQEVLIDGQQRITALFLYFNDLYVTSTFDRKNINFREIHKLCIDYSNASSKDDQKSIAVKLNALGVEKTSYIIKVDGKDIDITFSNFDERDREYLKQRAMYVTKIDCPANNNKKLYVNIFGLLNSAGKLLSPQEIRNGIFWDNLLYKALSEYNEKDTNWRRIYGPISKYSKDIECLLKMLALEYFSKIVEKDERKEIVVLDGVDLSFSWSNIMLRFSEISYSENHEKYINKLNSFFSNIENIDDKSKCNPAVLESIFVAFMLIDAPLNQWKIDYRWLCNIGEDKEIPFPHVLSNKGSVEERLSRSLELIYERYTV